MQKHEKCDSCKIQTRAYRQIFNAALNKMHFTTEDNSELWALNCYTQSRNIMLVELPTAVLFGVFYSPSKSKLIKSFGCSTSITPVEHKTLKFATPVLDLCVRCCSTKMTDHEKQKYTSQSANIYRNVHAQKKKSSLFNFFLKAPVSLLYAL